MTFYKTKKIFSWCLYDWANSVLATIIFTFIFPIYFAQNIIGNSTLGSVYWGYIVGFSGILIAVLAPILGCISDLNQRHKPCLFLLTIMCVLGTTCLFFALPDPQYTTFAIISVIITLVGFELAQSQYNATLSNITSHDTSGKISGIGWSMGYFGGLICLFIALFGFIGIEENADGFLGISHEDDLHIRSTYLLTASWYLIFSIPFFLYFHEKQKRTEIIKIKKITQYLFKIFQNLRGQNSNALRFLIASAIYRDGLNSLFTVGGIFAAGTFGMDLSSVLLFAIGLNLTSGIGALLFAFFEDKFGSKLIISLSLIALIILGTLAITAPNKEAFIAFALMLGLFIGPVQSSSRVLLHKISPEKQKASFFGLYALSGKSIAFTGPLLFSFITQITNDQRWGMASIIGLWLIGLFILISTKNIRTNR